MPLGVGGVGTPLPSFLFFGLSIGYHSFDFLFGACRILFLDGMNRLCLCLSVFCVVSL